MNSVIFTFDGQRIVPDYTPAYVCLSIFFYFFFKYQIVDGSIIESHTNVTGG
jgi:hypothetical protein